MSDGGKGSKPRPYSIDRKTFEDNWNKIFSKTPSDYQDILSTEDTLINALDKLVEDEKNKS